MDDAQRIVKRGNLSLHTAGGFFKKKWHKKYLVLYDGSKSGIKRLELFDSEMKFKKQNAAKIIALVDCVRVVTCQRNKTTYTFELRTSEQFYLLAAQSFQDMNDWVNCLRLVAFGETTGGNQQQSALVSAAPVASSPLNQKRLHQQQVKQTSRDTVDVLLDKRSVPDSSNQIGGLHQQPQPSLPAKISTASQAMMAASSALAKTRQRQPSLLGSCKPQPPTDSPFIQPDQMTDHTCTDMRQQPQPQQQQPLNAIGEQIDTLTPTVRGQLIGVAGNQLAAAARQHRQVAAGCDSMQVEGSQAAQSRPTQPLKTIIQRTASVIQAALDEEEENMLYCSIEDNPSEHNYRVKVIESELSLRCQLKCYQLTTPNAVSQQYDQIGNFKPGSGAYQPVAPEPNAGNLAPVIFYQLIVGPQELTLLNDYAIGASHSANKQQGLWSWPYQCIRRYGFDKDNCFMFEAGRKCTSGPGQFIVQTPKAYSIYQDVVKFVNELRCVSDPDQSANQLSVAQVASQRDDQRSGAVTQIPVSWAPECIDSRQHFFDSLRQMNHSAHPQPQPQPLAQPQLQQQQAQYQPNNGRQNHRVSAAEGSSMSVQRGVSSYPLANTHQLSQRPHLIHRNPATIPELCEHSSTSSSSSSSSSTSSASLLSLNKSSGIVKDNSGLEAGSIKSRPNSGDVTSEETDESGYEQGDESVDSSSSRSRMLAAELKQQRHSISSSSSTTSSNGSNGGGNDATSGPVYSVIQRPRPARDGELEKPQQSSPISRRWPPLKAPEIKQRQELMGTNMRTSNTEKLLSRLIADGPADCREQDFEANLMRDVYSEITKLHAAFAVTPYSE